MFGCCCKKCSPILVDEYENVTKVVPFAAGESDAPYARGWYQFSSTGCQLLSMYPPDCGEVDQAVCYTQGFDRTYLTQRENVTGIQGCTGDGGDMVSQVINNCYRKTGNKTTITRTGQRCGMGWKGVQAQSVWVGMFDFVTSAYCCAPAWDSGTSYPPLSRVTYGGSVYVCIAAGDNTGEIPSSSPSIWKAVSSSSTDTPQTKRTTIDETISFYGYNDYHDEWPPILIDWLESEIDWKQTATVDSYGNISRTGYKHGVGRHFFLGDPTLDPAAEEEDNCNGTPSIGWQPTPIPQGIGASCGIIEFSYRTTTAPNAPLITVYGTAAELTALKLWPVPPAVAKPSPGSSGEYCVFSGSVDTGTFTLSGDELKLTYSADYVLGIVTDLVEDQFNTIRYDYTRIIKLSGSSAFADTIAECKSLLNEWNLTDHAQYPWRTDKKTWLQPLVTRDAASTQPSINWTVDGNCNFIQENLYTGVIKGQPMPAGYGRFFNFTHINWERAETNGGSTCSACEMSLGSSSPAEIPPAATQWTNNFDGSQAYGPGGHVSQTLYYNYGTGSPGATPIDGVWMQKWAETAEAWPKQNEARPCGHDRWLRDEDDGCCVVTLTLVSGDDYELTLEDAPTAGDYAAGDQLGLDDGIYQVTSGSGIGPYGVTKIHALPDWVIWEGCAKLGYPTARAICGRIRPTSITQTAPDEITVVLPRKHWLRLTGDTVSFIDVDGLGTSVAATYVDETTFTVPGTLGTYGGAGYVHSPGTTETDWNKDTTCSEHKFVVREWLSDYRNNPGESIASKTLVEYDYAGATEPFVLCISPNSSDTPTSGIRYDFVDVDADMCFGEEWHKDFIQAIADPYWTATRKGGLPVDCSNAACAMDASPCSGEGCYRHYPLVEPTLATVADSDAPTAVLAPWCETEPTAAGTVHAIRAAWETCEEWKDEINANCGSRGY